MQIVPIQPVANQSLQCQLNGQACTINLAQMAYGTFIAVYVGATLIQGGVICENLNRIIRDTYLGFSGDLAFVDTQGNSDPIYTGFGSRFLLVYFSPSDLAAFGLTG